MSDPRAKAERSAVKDEQAAVRAVEDGRKVAGMVLREESIQATEDAGLVIIEVDIRFQLLPPDVTKR